MLRKLLILLNLAALAALWLVSLTPMVHPAAHPRVAILGLAFPLVVAVNALFVVVWLLVRRRMVLLPLAGMALAAGPLLDYCPMNAEKNAPAGAMKVITYNCHGYGVWRHPDDGTSPFDTVVAYLASSQADIICLQEAPAAGPYTTALVDSLRQIGYDTASARGQLLLTRLKILGSDSIPYPNRSGNASYATRLLRGTDTLVVINNHFESDCISEDYQADYAAAVRGEDVDLRALGHSFVTLLSSAAEVRASQVDSVTAYIDRLPQGRAVILCGDFNDTPLSYAYREMSRRLTSSFRESGRGVGLTYNKRKFPVRIDHIFHSPALRSFSTHVDRTIAVSDHFPVVTFLY